MPSDLGQIVQSILGGDIAQKPLGLDQIAVRSVLLYLLGLFLVRVGKSRLLSRATPLDVILAFVLGSLLSRGINGSASLSGTAVAAGSLVACHWCMSALSIRCHWLGDLIKGHTHVLVSNGEILWSNMRRSHISEHDLREEMRLKANADDLGRVKVAYKERSGEVGFVLQPATQKTIEFRVRDGVQTVRIELV